MAAGGKLYVGLFQGSYGGSFDASKSFQGNMSNLNIWDKVLSKNQIKSMATSCHVAISPEVVSWDNITRNPSGDVVISQQTCFV